MIASEQVDECKNEQRYNNWIRSIKFWKIEVKHTTSTVISHGKYTIGIRSVKKISIRKIDEKICCMDDVTHKYVKKRREHTKKSMTGTKCAKMENTIWLTTSTVILIKEKLNW